MPAHKGRSVGRGPPCPTQGPPRKVAKQRLLRERGDSVMKKRRGLVRPDRVVAISTLLDEGDHRFLFDNVSFGVRRGASLIPAICTACGQGWGLFADDDAQSTHKVKCVDGRNHRGA